MYSHTTKAILLPLVLISAALSAPLLPFYAEFTDNYWSLWNVVDVLPYSGGPSIWYASGSQLLQTSNIYTTLDEYTVYSGTYIWVGDCKWRDYTMMLRYRSTDDDGFGVMARYQNGNNFYRFLMVQDGANGGPFRRIEKRIGGTFTTLAQDNSAFTYPADFTWVNFIVWSDSLIVYLDGARFLAASDGDLSCGGVGIACYANNGLTVDDILVYPAKIDTAPYTTVVTGPYLQMATETTMTIGFEFNLPAAATVKYGTDTLCTSEIVDAAAQMRHLVQLTGLSPDTKYYYKIIAPDTVIGNERFWFKTKGSEDEFRLCIWGDNRTQHWEHYAVMHAMARESCDIAINVGDVVTTGGNYTQWQATFKGYYGVYGKAVNVTVQ